MRMWSLVLLWTLWSGPAWAYSGACAIWAMRQVGPSFVATNFAGTQAGADAAKAYVGTNGVIQEGPGCGTTLNWGTLPDSVMVLRSVGGKWEVLGSSVSFNMRGVQRFRADSLGVYANSGLITPRIGPYSTSTAGGAIRIIDGTTFPQNDTGVRAAYNEVKAAGGGMVVMPSGRYRWAAHVEVLDATGVTFAGAGDSTILWLDHTTGDDVFRVTGTANSITFRDFTIDGDYANNNAGRGIDVESGTARNITIENLTVTRTNDAAIASAAARTTIRNCRIYEIGDAIAGDRYGIRLYNSGTADSSRVTDNDVRSCKDGSLAVDANTDYVTVSGNNFFQPQGYGAAWTVQCLTTGGKYLLFKDNMVNGSDLAVLAVFGADSSKIVGNTFTNGRIYSGLYLLRGVSVLIANNTCTFNVHHGIYIGFDQGNCSNVMVTGNICSNNQGSGIIIDPSTTRTFTNIVVTGNMCTNNTASGISSNAASFASTAYIGNNILIGNGSTTSLNATNWTYQAPSDDVGLFLGTYTNATLGTPPNGTIRYCSDCTKATPCAGGGTGSFAFRKVGAWDCNP